MKTVSSLKGCEILKAWHQSVINHLYWSVVSSPEGDEELIVAKWQSIERQMQNIHRGHGKRFPKCAHGRLQGKDRNKKRIKPSKLEPLMLCQVMKLSHQ